MATPKQQAKASNPKPKEITLPSGAVATRLDFKGKHVRAAQRLADGDPSKSLFAIISVVTLIDGKPILMEDIDEMGGPDVIALMAEFNDVF